MARLNSYFVTALFSVAVFASSVNGAKSAIITTDFLAAGDRLILQDTETNLEWLKVRATTPFSTDGALTAFGSSTYGFSLSGRSTAATFLQHLGFNIVDSSNQQNVVDFNNHFSYFDSGPLLYDHAAYSDPNAQNGLFVSRYIFAFGMIGFATSGTWLSSQDNDRTGSMLYRNISVVPLPPSAILFGSALLGLAGLRRRKKKAQI